MSFLIPLKFISEYTIFYNVNLSEGIEILNSLLQQCKNIFPKNYNLDFKLLL